MVENVGRDEVALLPSKVNQNIPFPPPHIYKVEA